MFNISCNQHDKKTLCHTLIGNVLSKWYKEKWWILKLKVFWTWWHLVLYLPSFSQRVSCKSKFCWSTSFRTSRFGFKIFFCKTVTFYKVNSHSLMCLVYEFKIVLLYLTQSTLRLTTPFSHHFHSSFCMYKKQQCHLFSINLFLRFRSNFICLIQCKNNMILRTCNSYM